MRLSRPFGLLTAAGALLATGVLGLAQIEELTLQEMVSRTENSVFGTITNRTVDRYDHPVDGPELYFTTLTVQGRSLVNGLPITVDVTYPGGFIDEEHGVYNSEAPSEDDVQLGNKVVVFYKWLDNMGGEVAGNRLWASHGGLFRAAVTRRGTVVLGRGDGYCIPANVPLPTLDQRITEISEKVEGR